MTTYTIDWKNGDNTTGNGSSGLPWKTLTKALTVVGNNDTILCRGSDASDEIYREYAMSTVRTGLTIAADSGHTPTFTPSTRYTSWALTAGQSFTYETAFTPAACWYCMNGSLALTVRASIALVEANVNSFFADLVNDKLYVHIAGGGAPSSIEAFASVSALLTSAGAGIAYSNIRVQWCGLGLELTNAGTISSCTVRYHGGAYGGDRACVRITTAAAANVTNCILSGQYGSSTGSVGILQNTGAAMLTITDCSFISMRYGYYQTNKGGTLTIDNCTFTLCHDPISVGATSVAVTAIISNCTAYDVGHGAYQLSGAAVTGTLTNCLAYVPAGYTLINLHGFIAEAGANGTFYNCLAVGFLEDGVYILSSATAIVKNCGAVACKIGFKKDTATLTADYNGVYGSTTSAYGGTGPWAPGAHDVTAAPLFVDQAGYDYHLTALSPWRDAGVDVGLSYQGAAPDIGRYEFVPIFEMLATLSAVSVTPAADVAVQRAMVAVLMGASSTPAADLAVQRAVAAVLMGASSTPAADLAVQRAVAAVIVAVSATGNPDLVATVIQRMRMAFAGRGPGSGWSGRRGGGTMGGRAPDEDMSGG
jgi:hypothetical protein